MNTTDTVYAYYKIRVKVPLCLKKYLEYKAREQKIRPTQLYSELITTMLSSDTCWEEMERLAKTSGDSEWLQSLLEYKHARAEKKKTKQDRVERGEEVVKPRRVSPEPQIADRPMTLGDIPY